MEEWNKAKRSRAKHEEEQRRNPEELAERLISFQKQKEHNILNMRRQLEEEEKRRLDNERLRNMPTRRPCDGHQADAQVKCKQLYEDGARRADRQRELRVLHDEQEDQKL